MGVLSSLRFVVRHPLNRGRSVRALLGWLRWQVGSRLAPGAVLVDFVDDAVLRVEPGMTGATGNVYTGLHEFEDMAFLLHLLRPGDLFVDVGANVGSYTVLASAVAGARTVAFEPVPSSFRALRRNCDVNGIGERVELSNAGVGRSRGTLRFTASDDCVNHVATAAESGRADLVEVPVVVLDSALDGRCPRLLKIDVEGYETEVVAGASRTLTDPELACVIMETNGSGGRYGHDERALHASVLAHGFRPCRYAPFERRLTELDVERAPARGGGNALYVRDVEAARARVAAAPGHTVRGRRL